MKRMICNVILPGVLIGLIVIVCYPICMKEDGFDFFQFWILSGFLFGFRKMSMVLIPKNYGIGGSLGVLALNCIIGGLIGGIIVVVRIVRIVAEFVSIVIEHFWTKSPKVEI